MASLTPVSGPLGIFGARHLLRRLLFGYTQQQISTYASQSAQTCLTDFFNAFSIPESPKTPAGEEVIVPIANLSNEEKNRLNQFWQNWWLGLMYQDQTGLEKLTFFLHTVITNRSEVVESHVDYYYQIALFRQYVVHDFTDTNPAFNRYNQLVKKICVDNAMLIFLDGRLNVKGRPNENFARELFELFAIGKGQSRGPGDYTNYTERDIIEAAKVFTGWVNTDDYTFLDPDTNLPCGTVRGDIRNVNQHDNSVKQFSDTFKSASFPDAQVKPKQALLNGTLPTLESCRDEISQLIDMVFSKIEASQHFIRKLYRFYVHWNITEEIEADIIIPLAEYFKETGFRIRPVLERLLMSEHFFENAGAVTDNQPGGLIKSPLDLIFGTMKFFKVDIGATNSASFYEYMTALKTELAGMQFNYLNPYDVAGYEPYHQTHGYSRNWITTTSLANRYNFIQKLLNQNTPIKIDLIAWSNDPSYGLTDDMATTSTDVDGQKLAIPMVRHMCSMLLPYSNMETEISQPRYNYFALFHLGGLSFDNWVFSWKNRNSGEPSITMDVQARIQNVLNVILQSPEYQLF